MMDGENNNIVSLTRKISCAVAIKILQECISIDLIVYIWKTELVKR